MDRFNHTRLNHFQVVSILNPARMPTMLPAFVLALLLASSGCHIQHPYPSKEELFLPEQSATIDGVRINYEYTHHDDNQPTLVLLHGLGASLHTWDTIHPSLLSRYNTMRIDLKGFGNSAKPVDDDYSVDDQASYVVKLINQKIKGPVVIVGHSFGGAVGLLASRNLPPEAGGSDKGPHLVGLILIAAAVVDQEIPLKVRMLSYPFVQSFIDCLISPTFRTRRTLKYLMENEKPITTELTESYSYYYALPGSVRALEQTIDQLDQKRLGPNLEQALAATDLDTLVIWGQEDPLLPVDNVDRISKLLKSETIVVLEECGHLPHEEFPEQTVDVIVDYLDK